MFGDADSILSSILLMQYRSMVQDVLAGGFPCRIMSRWIHSPKDFSARITVAGENILPCEAKSISKKRTIIGLRLPRLGKRGEIVKKPLGNGWADTIGKGSTAITSGDCTEERLSVS
jgi:hypothetical protein